MSRIKRVLFSAVVFGLLVAAPARGLFGQTTYTADFESPTFVLGNVQGQNGWGHLPNSPAGGVIEAAPAGSPASFAKGQQYAPQVVNVTGDIENLNFEPQ